MTRLLDDKKIAILVANGFEQSELTEPKKVLTENGAIVEIISPEESDKVMGWKHGKWGDEFLIDVPLIDANPDDYHALVLPGGVMNPDKLRMDTLAIDFVRDIYKMNKPIAAICHGPWTLIDAGIVNHCKMTSWPSIKQDLINAGAIWVDEEVVVDNNIITSRKPSDIRAIGLNFA